MRNSQGLKLKLLNFFIVVFLVVINIFFILYLIYNQFYALLSYVIIFESIIIGTFALYFLNKYKRVKNELSNCIFELENLKQEHEKVLDFNKETMSELETSNAELKTLNLQLIKSKKELQELSDYRGRFLVNVSHELRTPLNAIIGFTTIMTADDYDPKSGDFKEMLKVIHESSKRLLNLINNILNIAKLETDITEIKHEPISFDSIFHSIVSIGKGLLAHNNKVIFTYESDDNLPTVIADEKNLLRALTQFIDNAAKYTDKGEILFTAKSLPDCLEIIIKDTGIGIPDSKLKKLKEPFLSQFNEEGKLEKLDTEKSGFNFAIAKYLIEKMGGEFFVDSKENLGTTIRVRLKKG